MIIVAIHSYQQDFELTRPYKIAYKTQTSVENVILEMITDDGRIGLGAASPAVEVTGESFDDCLKALNPFSLSWFIGKDIGDFPYLREWCFEKLGKTPAA